MMHAPLPSLFRSGALVLLPLLGVALTGCTSNPPLPAPEVEEPNPEADELLADAARQEEVQRINRMAAREATVHQGGEDPAPALTTAPDPTGDLAIEKKTRELYVAELELHLAEEKVRHGESKSVDELGAAARAVRLAQEALVHYKQKEAPRLVAEQRLKVDRQTFKVQESQQNLDQMSEEYGKYETDSAARKTGEIVIWRAETQLALSERSLKGTQNVLEDLTGSKIPLQIEKLEEAILVGEQGLRKARESVERLAVENKLSVTRAGNKKVFLEMELKQMQKSQVAKG